MSFYNLIAYETHSVPLNHARYDNQFFSLFHLKPLGNYNHSFRFGAFRHNVRVCRHFRGELPVPTLFNTMHTVLCNDSCTHGKYPSLLTDTCITAGKYRVPNTTLLLSPNFSLISCRITHFC